MSEVKLGAINLCGPQRTCPDGTPHDMSKWVEFEDMYGCACGTAVCGKCGHFAIDDAYWS